jgi:hypothetical protein
VARTVLALARSQISGAEECCFRQREDHDREGNEGRIREEGRKATPAQDGETDIEESSEDLRNASLGASVIAVPQSKLDSGLRLETRREVMLDGPHFGHAIGGGDELRLGVAAGYNHGQLRPSIL